MNQPEGQPESPTFPLKTTEGDIVLHWFNCRLRLFRDRQFNHLEYHDGENNLRGIRLGQAAMDWLFENEFPYAFDPQVDDQTLDWFIRSEVKDLDDELEGL